MGSIKDEETKKEYEQYVKEVTPKKSLALPLVKAFAVGGFICMIGEGILQECERIGLDKEMSGAWSSLILVAASAILTGLNIYQKLVAFSGAGALVPITGFANSVAAPAIEFQKEGQVFGIGCKIFTIAGPVILYGVFVSWALGLIYWIGKCFGWC